MIFKTLSGSMTSTDATKLLAAADSSCDAMLEAIARGCIADATLQGMNTAHYSRRYYWETIEAIDLCLCGNSVPCDCSCTGETSPLLCVCAHCGESKDTVGAAGAYYAIPDPICCQ